MSQISPKRCTVSAFTRTFPLYIHFQAIHVWFVPSFAKKYRSRVLHDEQKIEVCLLNTKKLCVHSQRFRQHKHEAIEYASITQTTTPISPTLNYITCILWTLYARSASAEHDANGSRYPHSVRHHDVPSADTEPGTANITAYRVNETAHNTYSTYNGNNCKKVMLFVEY